MTQRKRLTEQHLKINGSLPWLVHRKLSWKMVVALLGLMVISALTVHFFERISYQSSLTQEEQQYTQLQDAANQQRLDLKHLISNTKTQLNCLQLQSDAGKQLCQQHNATTNL